jgi:acyl carrier protein
MDDIDPSQPLSFHGLDSLDAMLLSRNLQEKFGIEIPQVKLLSDTSLADLQEMAKSTDKAKYDDDELPILLRKGTGPPVV